MGHIIDSPQPQYIELTWEVLADLILSTATVKIEIGKEQVSEV